MKTITLMCGDKKCCPVVGFGKRIVTIKDDFGGKVKLNHEQALKLIEELSCQFVENGKIK